MLEVPEQGIKVREMVIIVSGNEDNWHTNKDDLTGSRGTVVTCCRKHNYESHSVVMYVLPDNFRGYSPLILVKETPQSMWRQEEAAHLCWWEVPPRNKEDRESRQECYLDVDPQHWTEREW